MLEKGRSVALVRDDWSSTWVRSEWSVFSLKFCSVCILAYSLRLAFSTWAATWQLAAVVPSDAKFPHHLREITLLALISVWKTWVKNHDPFSPHHMILSLQIQKRMLGSLDWSSCTYLEGTVRQWEGLPKLFYSVGTGSGV